MAFRKKLFTVSSGSRNTAAALPLVLWGISFVSAMVVMVAVWMGERLDNESRSVKAFRAYELALRGLALGMHQAVKPGDPLLTARDAKNDEGYTVEILDESGRINPNSIIYPENRELFRTLFSAWEIPLDRSDAAIDSLIDWIDEDNLRSLAGAEDPEYRAVGIIGLPPNSALTREDEMAYVLNLRDVLAAHAGWQSYFTVWYSGKINIKETSPDILRDIGGFSDLEIETLQTYLRGEDAALGTEDDGPVTTLDDALAVAGISGPRATALADYFDVAGKVRRIESTGFCADEKCAITVIVGASGDILSWECSQ